MTLDLICAQTWHVAMCT